MTWSRRVAATLIGLAAAAMIVLAGASSASAISLPCPPGSPGGDKLSPANRPDRGFTAQVLPRPHDINNVGDPFAPNSKTSIADAYGLNWAKFDAYDPGCAGEALSSPGTGVANAIMRVPVWFASLTAGAGQLVYEPAGWLGKLNPAITATAGAMNRAIFTPLGPLALGAAGISIIWASRRMQLSAALTTALTIGAALTVVYIGAFAPVRAANEADAALTAGAAALNQRVGGNTTSSTPALATIAPFVDGVMWTRWVDGTFGDDQSATARRFAVPWFKCRNLTWAEAARLERNPDSAQKVYEGKADDCEAIAEKIHDADPDAYAYLQGQRGGRWEAALFVLLAGYTLTFVLISYVLIGLGYLIIRTITMLAPAWGTVAMVPRWRSTLRAAGETLASAIINPIVFAAGATVVVMANGFLLNPGSGLGWWGIAVAAAITAIMWRLLSPYRRMKALAFRSNPVEKVTQGFSNDAAAAKNMARRAGATAIAVFAGEQASKALDRDDDDDKDTDEGETPAPEWVRPPEPAHHAPPTPGFAHAPQVTATHVAVPQVIPFEDPTPATTPTSTAPGVGQVPQAPTDTTPTKAAVNTTDGPESTGAPDPLAPVAMEAPKDGATISAATPTESTGAAAAFTASPMAAPAGEPHTFIDLTNSPLTPKDPTVDGDDAAHYLIYTPDEGMQIDSPSIDNGVTVAAGEYVPVPTVRPDHVKVGEGGE